MLAGLKNDNEQAEALEPFSDFAVVEVVCVKRLLVKELREIYSIFLQTGMCSV